MVSVVLWAPRECCVLCLGGKAGGTGPALPEACLVAAAAREPACCGLQSVIGSRARLGVMATHSEPGAPGISEVSEEYVEGVGSCQGC